MYSWYIGIGVPDQALGPTCKFGISCRIICIRV